MNRSRSRIFIGAVLLSLGLILAACGGKTSEEPGPPPELPEDAEPLVLLAKFDLALKTGQDIENIITKSIEETLFDDSSLGVPQPGAEYEAMITPGYIILLNSGGEIYEYHASGAKVVQVPKE
jgi:hypothetical protein